MRRNKISGISILEVLVSASLFTIVILGISQTVLLMYRYSISNLYRTQAHLYATSILECLLHNTHPYELMDKAADATNGNKTSCAKITTPNPRYETIFLDQDIGFNLNLTSSSNGYKSTLMQADKNRTIIPMEICGQTIYLYTTVQINDSLSYEEYGSKKRQEINPPEGFQSIHISYCWSTSNNLSDSELSNLSKNELYAIRPMQPDDPEIN